MDNPIRRNKPAATNITQTTIDSESTSAPEDQKRISAGISQAKDSFEEIKTNTSSLFEVREGVESMNEDKKYYLNKLSQHNKIADKLSEELTRLVDISQDLSAMEKDGNSAIPTRKKNP